MLGTGLAATTAAAAVAVVVSACVYLAKLDDNRRQKERAQVTVSAVYALSLIAWPAAFVAVLWVLNGTAIEDSMLGSDGRRSYGVAFALFWPLLLLTWDLVQTGGRRRSSEPDETQRYIGTKSNAAIIVGGAWALGTLLSIISGRSGGHSAESAKIVMLSLVLCIAFVLPTPGDGPRRSVTNLTIGAWQKSALNYAIGFFVLGIVLAWRPA